VPLSWFWAGEEAASPPFMCAGSSTRESASVTFMPLVLPSPDWPSHAFACSHTGPGVPCCWPPHEAHSVHFVVCAPHRRRALHEADSQPFVPMVPKCIRLPSPGQNVKVLRCPSYSPPRHFPASPRRPFTVLRTIRLRLPSFAFSTQMCNHPEGPSYAFIAKPNLQELQQTRAIRDTS
jgi:hypothetical protein